VTRQRVALFGRHTSVLPYLDNTPACCLIWVTRQRVALFDKTRWRVILFWYDLLPFHANDQVVKSESRLQKIYRKELEEQRTKKSICFCYLKRSYRHSSRECA